MYVGILGLDELNLSIKLECLELDLFYCECVKSPIPNMDCENNHEFAKNRSKRGSKEHNVKIKPSWDVYFCLMLEYVICVGFILSCFALYK